MKKPGMLARISAAIAKALPRTLSPVLGGGGAWNGWGEWWGTIKEPFTGAWQRNIEWCADSVISNPTVFSCITLKASSIGKLPMKLVRKSGTYGVWKEAQSAAFSPVIRRPNRYQNTIQFLTQWVISLEFRGNTYVLLERDARQVVIAMYILDPGRVQPLVSSDGSIFYQLQPDNLANEQEAIIVPASEIIHDRINPIFHPLIGVSPIFAAGLAAAQSTEIQNNSARFFKNGAKISGILMVPGAVDPTKATQLKEKWDAGYTGENAGKVAVLADGMKFQPLTMSAVDAQVIDQLKWDDEKICACFHVPGYKVQVGQMPAQNSIPQLNMEFFQQALQSPIAGIECAIRDGLALPDDYAVWIDESELLRMDEASRWAVYAEAIGCAGMTPNEARAREWLDPKTGGDELYLQQQNYSLTALSKRDAKDDPFSTGSKSPPSTPDSPTNPTAAAAPVDGGDSSSKALSQIEVRALTADYFGRLLDRKAA